MPTNPLPCSYSVLTQPSITLNAITPTADHERRERHLRLCARLAEIGMELVEAAHEEALDDIRMRADRRISPITGEPAHLEGRDTTFAELVALLSRCVRQAILLEARLAAGAYDLPDAEPRPAQNQTPPRPPAAHPAALTEVSADRLYPERLEDDLAKDAHRAAPAILAGIQAELAQVIETTGLAAKPSHPGAEAPHPAPARSFRDRPRRPPPPLSQAERARQLYLEQTTHPPGRPHRPP